MSLINIKQSEKRHCIGTFHFVFLIELNLIKPNGGNFSVTKNRPCARTVTGFTSSHVLYYCTRLKVARFFSCFIIQKRASMTSSPKIGTFKGLFNKSKKK